MASSSWQILALCGALAIAAGADARTPDRATASALEPRRIALRQFSPGVIVLHFGPALGAAACRQEGKTFARARTLFREYRTADGEPLAINGHVALRFKTSTSAAQIDSLIAATGVEAFPAAAGTTCRRYVIRVVHPEDDPRSVASALTYPPVGPRGSPPIRTSSIRSR